MIRSLFRLLAGPPRTRRVVRQAPAKASAKANTLASVIAQALRIVFIDQFPAAPAQPGWKHTIDSDRRRGQLKWTTAGKHHVRVTTREDFPGIILEWKHAGLAPDEPPVRILTWALTDRKDSGLQVKGGAKSRPGYREVVNLAKKALAQALVADLTTTLR